MKNLFGSKTIISTAVLLAIVASQQVSAASITFGGQAAGDGSGQTSSRISDPSHAINNGTGGFFVETFDQATNIDGAPAGDTQYNEPGLAADSATCAVNGTGGGITVNTSASTAFGVRKGSVPNVAAQPLNDSTCYGHTPAEGGDLPSWVEIDYSGFLAAQGGGVRIDYLGFYWGSVDNYNDFEFFSGDDSVAKITGPELLALSNAASGDQTDPDSNRYVNIDFSFAESFDRVRVSTSGIAGEFDNIVIGLNNRQVPSPAGLAFLGLGLLGLSFSRKFGK